MGSLVNSKPKSDTKIHEHEDSDDNEDYCWDFDDDTIVKYNKKSNENNNLLIHGYIKNVNNKYDLSHTISSVLIDIILKFYCTNSELYGIGKEVNTNRDIRKFSLIETVSLLIDNAENLYPAMNTYFFQTLRGEIYFSSDINKTLNINHKIKKLNTKHCVMCYIGNASIESDQIFMIDDKNKFYSTHPQELYIQHLELHRTLYHLSEFDKYFKYLNIKQISCGNQFTIILTKTGQMFSFGNNANGQCGLNETIKKVSFPQQIKFLKETTKIIDICCGESYCLCINKNNQLYGFGYNYHYEIGVNYKRSYFGPKLVMYFVENHIKIISIKTGSNHSLCIDDDNKYYIFGSNNFGQIGNNSDRNNSKYDKNNDVLIPHQLNSCKFIIDINLGSDHTVLLNSLGEIYTFGCNQFNQCSITKDTNKCLFKPYLLSKKEMEINENKKIIKVYASTSTTYIYVQ